MFFSRSFLTNTREQYVCIGDDDDDASFTAAYNGHNEKNVAMKPITFENLRRLIGGRRKNKDRNESPFKRSESFKRISIRRNYLESRGGGGGGQKGRNPTKKPPPLKDDDFQQRRPSSEITAVDPSTRLLPPADDHNFVSSSSLPASAATIVLAPHPSPPCKDDVTPPSLAEQKRRVVTPVPNLLAPAATPLRPSSPLPTTTTTTTAAPVIDYGEWIRCIRAEEDLNNLKRSRSPPTPPVRYRYHHVQHKELDDSSRTDSAISLGRIWMDAPMLLPTAPRSLELPARPVATADNDGTQQQQRRAHHSLESALKDKRDDRPVPSRRFHRYPIATDKTASRSSVASTCSGKDSGFSLSAPGLSDPPRPAKQLFRKKVPRRPAAVATACKSSASVGISPLPPSTTQQADQLYQVVVARSPLRQLKLDPMIFVPPEKRRTAQHHNNHNYNLHRHHHYHHHHHHHHHDSLKPRTVVEIRDYCVPKDARLQQRDEDDDDDEQDRLYESISKGVSRRWQESTDDADTEEELHDQQQQRASTAAVVCRNRVKRKKSARRNIKYVVKPVRRAPSAATRKPSVPTKTKSARIASSSTCVLLNRRRVMVAVSLCSPCF